MYNAPLALYSTAFRSIGRSQTHAIALAPTIYVCCLGQTYICAYGAFRNVQIRTEGQGHCWYDLFAAVFQTSQTELFGHCYTARQAALL
jgi:hypothetical protein